MAENDTAGAWISFDFSHGIATAHLFNVTKYCGEIFQGYEDSVTVLSR
ncbi:hypothetical protein [Collimonas sp. OK307]|nr:hypothetical protein [Collimonas sp. OK307]